jgi:hypothetical protein
VHRRGACRQLQSQGHRQRLVDSRPAQADRRPDRRTSRASVAPMPPRPRAVLVLAGGIGDLLRWASLVPVLDAAGHDVDCSSLPTTRTARRCSTARRESVVCGSPTRHSRGGCRPTKHRRRWPCSPTGRRALPTGYRPAARSAPTASAGETEGDPGCATAIARELGWSGPLPVPPLAPALRAGKPTVAAGPWPSTPAARPAGRGRSGMATASWRNILAACCASAHRPTKTPAAPISLPRSAGRHTSRMPPRRVHWPRPHA